MSEVLLLYPPLAHWRSPSLGLASIVAHLQAARIPCRLLDMNHAFASEFPNGERMARGLEYAGDRLAQLHAMPQLGFTDILEYCFLGSAVVHRHAVERAMDSVTRAGTPLPGSLGFQDSLTRLQIASFPFFPEHISMELFYMPAFSEYSTAEILESVNADSLLAGFFERQLAPLASTTPPRIVGISVLAPSQVVPAFRCAAVARRLFPGTHITMGGSTISCHFRNMESPRLFALVDSIVIDEGEIPLVRLWEELGSPAPDMSRVPNLVWLDDGAVRRNAPAPRLALTDQPVPAYEAFSDVMAAAPTGHVGIPLRLSKGCNWGKCTFCRTHLPLVHDYQHAPADFLFEQIRELNRLGHERFSFVNESPDPGILRALCGRLAGEGVHIAWRSPMRFDKRLTLECCMAFRRAGCVMLNLGLETYTDRVLRLMRKGTNTALIDRVLLNLAWSGLPPHADMIVGFPGETEEEARDSFRVLKQKMNDGHLSHYTYNIFSLLPDSEIYRNPDRYGISDICVPEGYDLDPPLCRFAAPGLGRVRAAGLEFEFNDHTWADRLAGAAPETVQLNGGTFSFRYDVRQLFSHIQAAVVTSSCGANRIRLGNSTVAPLRPDARSGKAAAG